MIAGRCSCGKANDAPHHKPGKHPATPNGVTDATTDEATIRRWFGDSPWLGVGIAFERDTLGIDNDPRNGGDATVAAWLEAHGPIPETPHARTGSGGDHWYFRLPPGWKAKNDSRYKLTPGIDTRTLGGYLVAPPTRHMSGGVYSWATPLVGPDALAIAPEWLVRAVAEPVGPSQGDRSAIAERSAGGMGGTPSATTFTFNGDEGEDDFVTAKGVGQGRRHGALLRLVGIHTDRGDSTRSIVAGALAWGQRCDPPCDEDEAAIVRMVENFRRKDEARKQGREAGTVVEVGDEGVVAGANDPASWPGIAGSQDHKPQVDPAPASDPDLRSCDPMILTQNAGSEVQTPGADTPDPSNPTTVHALDEAEVVTNVPLDGVPFRGEGRGSVDTKGSLVGGRGDGLSGVSDGDYPDRGFAATHPSPTSDADADGHEEEVEANDAWPKLHEDALHGLVGDIVRAMGPETEADPAALLVTLLVQFGSIVGNGPRYSMAAGTHHANLFATIVAPSGVGKGQSWGLPYNLMRLADPHWADHCQARGLSSGEGLVDAVKDEEPGEGADFFGDADPCRRLMCHESEMAKPITAMRRDGNTLSPIIRSAWDSQPLEVLTRGKSKLKASHAHISIVGHITPEECMKLLSESVEVANGFSNRFLWVAGRRSNILPDGGDPDCISPYIEPMKLAIATAKGIKRVSRDAASGKLWHEVYEELTEPKPGGYGKAVGRGHAQTLRLSLLYALVDGSHEIRVEHLRAALALWRYCDASARMIFAPSMGGGGGLGVEVDEPVAIKLLNLILKAPGVTRRTLAQALPSKSRGLLGATLDKLREGGQAHPREVQTGGRRAEGWFPGPDPGGPREKPKSSTVFTFSMSDDAEEVQGPREGAGGGSGGDSLDRGEAATPPSPSRDGVPPHAPTVFIFSMADADAPTSDPGDDARIVGSKGSQDHKSGDHEATPFRSYDPGIISRDRKSGDGESPTYDPAILRSCDPTQDRKSGAEGPDVNRDDRHLMAVAGKGGLGPPFAPDARRRGLPQAAPLDDDDLGPVANCGDAHSFGPEVLIAGDPVIRTDAHEAKSTLCQTEGGHEAARPIFSDPQPQPPSTQEAPEQSPDDWAASLVDAIYRQGVDPHEALKAHGVRVYSREEVEAMEAAPDDDDFDDEDDDEPEAESEGEGGDCGPLIQWMANRMADRLGIERPDPSEPEPDAHEVIDITPQAEAESVAIDGDDFFGELEADGSKGLCSTENLPPKVVASGDDLDVDAGVPGSTGGLPHEHIARIDEPEQEDVMSLEDFHGYLQTNLGREVDYRHPDRLTHGERLVVKYAQNYALKRARERKLRRENPGSIMGEAEFDRALDAALVR